jgi:peptide/nickel transport system substrate-binding protein
MRNKVLWFLLTLLTVMAVILTSCKTETTTTGETEIVKGKVITSAPPTEEKRVDTTLSEKPQYGGVATLALSADVGGFDEGWHGPSVLTTQRLTHEELLQGDWAQGPEGTGKADWTLSTVNSMSLKTGSLADSWQIPQKGKVIFHIREGVYWQNKPPTSGRALTVDDVVFSLKRVCTESAAYVKTSYPNLAKTVVITGDETTRTVTIETPDIGEWANAITIFPDYVTIVPRDAVEKLGKGMDQWQNSIGTGPFLMTDYVSNGSLTFVRNPNFWETNPVGPGKGDKLPYLEGVKLLIITDTATRFTAMRTGKIDGTAGEWDDVGELIEGNPEMQYTKYVADTCYTISMRTDKADSPFSKKEVRQALFLATDFNKIKNEFYDGKAEILVWPISPEKEYWNAYYPLEQLPANVQELYSHNVTKAKELLAAAGYTTGFPATIITYNTATFIDYLSLIQSMWAEVGVKLTIDAKDYATWISRVRSRNYDELFWGVSAGWEKLLNFNGTSFYNSSYVNDPIVVETAAKMADYIGVDDAKLEQLHHDLMPYVLEQCWVIAKPNPYTYVIWWPWVKNWHGELSVGYVNYPSYLKYRWQDVALKQKMLND